MKQKVYVLRPEEIRGCVPLDHEAIAAVEDGFRRLAMGQVVVPPIVSLEFPESNGELDIKTAYAEGLEGIAVKVATGFYDNRLYDLPTASGIMVLFSARTGFPLAVLLDQGYLTQVRTGAAGALAAKHLARKQLNTVAIIGAGTQGRFQLTGLKQVRSLSRVLVYDSDPRQIEEFADEMSTALQLEVVGVANPEAAVRESDVVVTATPSHEPYIEAEWLHPGLHITAVGADAPEKQEIETRVFEIADLISCDLKSQAFVRGELHHALEAASIPERAEIVELGELVNGERMGRVNDEQITLCDLTGVGIQDTVIALLAYEKARAKGLGMRIEV